MGPLRYVKAEDHVTGPPPGPQMIDPKPLCGTWMNTNTRTRGIAKVVIAHRDVDTVVRVFAAGTQGMIDWGEVKADVVYAKDVASKGAMAFAAQYDFGSMKSLLQANLSLGLLVVAGLNTFKDDSRRSNYFSREFFYRAE